MSIVKQDIIFIFNEGIKVESEIFQGSNRNAPLLMQGIETAVEASPGVTVERPPDVSDVSPNVVGNKWEGITVTFNRKSMLKGGVVVNPDAVQQVVEQELEMQDFDAKIVDRKIRISR